MSVHLLTRLGGEWTQEKPKETFMVSQTRKGPPILPPHLLQVSTWFRFFTFCDIIWKKYKFNEKKSILCIQFCFESVARSL